MATHVCHFGVIQITVMVAIIIIMPTEKSIPTKSEVGITTSLRCQRDVMKDVSLHIVKICIEGTSIVHLVYTQPA